ncbi:SDR family NAD(P)-dependent oxidoreductase [Streptomyces turgidiscabies]|uniref:SDR family NAD(P)-dependent oxidoreductase n=1 Tax=Streptomyces turgidiscabies TaxID=85558 RepID=UPI00389A77C9
MVVTGGSTGPWLGAAERFVAEGATVHLVGRRQPELDVAVARPEPAAVAVRADVTVNDDLDRLYTTIAERDGPVDVVVANAGEPPFGTIDSYTGEELDASYALNLRGVAFTVQKALPLMPQGGSIVLVRSIEGERGSPGLGAYAAMKAAKQSMVRLCAPIPGPRVGWPPAPLGRVIPLPGRGRGGQRTYLPELLQTAWSLGSPTRTRAWSSRSWPYVRTRLLSQPGCPAPMSAPAASTAHLSPEPLRRPVRSGRSRSPPPSRSIRPSRPGR